MYSNCWISQPDRHIVQIYTKDRKKIVATILAIPNYRLKATDQTVITFREMPAGEPEAIRAWFYPGMNWGEEFVYPRARAIELSKTSKTPVLFIPAEVVTAPPVLPEAVAQTLPHTASTLPLIGLLGPLAVVRLAGVPHRRKALAVSGHCLSHGARTTPRAPRQAKTGGEPPAVPN